MSEKKKMLKKYLPHLFVFFFILLFLIQNHVYIRKDNSLPFSDSDGQLLKISHYLLFDKIELDRIIARDPYPPLAHMTGFIFFKLMGPSLDTAQYSLFVFIIIFLLSMYGIGYEYGGHFSGAAVMALAASSPHIINYSRFFFLDFPQTAMTALTFYILLKTDGYKNRSWSLLLGFVFLLSFFTKWSTTFFLIVPLLWFVIPHMLRSLRAFILGISFAGLSVFLIYQLREFVSKGEDFFHLVVFKIFLFNFVLPGVIFLGVCFLFRKFTEKNWNEKTADSVNRVLNAIYSALIMLSMTTLWMLWASRPIHEKILMDTGIFGDWGFRVSRNFNALMVFYNYLPLLVLPGIILIFAFRNRDDFKPESTGIYNRLILPVNLVFTFFLLSYMGPYDIRYILSCCIFIAALGGWWVGWLKNYRIPLTAGIAVLSILSLTGWLFIPQNSGILREIKPDPYTEEVRNPAFLMNPRGWLTSMNPIKSLNPLTPMYPVTEKYDVEPIIEILQQEAKNGTKKIFWISEIGDEPVSGDYINFLMISKGIKFNFADVWRDGSNKEILEEAGIVFITCHNKEFAEKWVECLKEQHKNEEIHIGQHHFPKGNYLVIVRI